MIAHLFEFPVVIHTTVVYGWGRNDYNCFFGLNSYNFKPYLRLKRQDVAVVVVVVALQFLKHIATVAVVGVGKDVRA